MNHLSTCAVDAAKKEGIKNVIKEVITIMDKNTCCCQQCGCKNCACGCAQGKCDCKDCRCSCKECCCKDEEKKSKNV